MRVRISPRYFIRASALHGCADGYLWLITLRSFLLLGSALNLIRFSCLGCGASLLFCSRSYTSACIEAHVCFFFLFLAFASRFIIPISDLFNMSKSVVFGLFYTAGLAVIFTLGSKAFSLLSRASRIFRLHFFEFLFLPCEPRDLCTCKPCAC